MKMRILFVLFCGIFMLSPSTIVQAKEKAPEFLTFAGGGIGGAWYLGAAKLASFADKSCPGISASAVPSGGVENIRKVEKGQYQFGFTFSSDVYAASKGLPPFKEPADIKFLASTNPAYVIIVANPPIKTFRDLEGKKINGGVMGMSGYAMTEKLVKAYGLEGKVTIVSSNYDKMADMQVDGIVDATLVYGSVPHLAPSEILTRREVNFIPVDEDVRAKLNAGNPGYVKLDIPADSFKGQTKPVPTIGSMTCVIVGSTVPANIVYDLLKYTWAHRSELVSAHSVYKQFTPEVVPLGRTIPWHPGAEKFWKEVGVIK